MAMLAKDCPEDLKKENNFIKFLGWLMAEKWDGYRALWVDGKLLSRNGKEYNAPEWFTACLPKDIQLDGEIWIDRYSFQEVGKIRKKNPNTNDWLNISYKLYDIPSLKEPFSNRHSKLKLIVKDIEKEWENYKLNLPDPLNSLKCPIKITTQTLIKSNDQLINLYNKIINNGGEGLIIKNPESYYESKRSDHMYKIKPDYDAESIIIDYKNGTGKYEGKLGAFICHPLINFGEYSIIDNEKTFTLSGMNDEIRGNYLKTHPTGTIITYAFSGKTEKGIPRFPRYIRKRDDIIIKYTDNKIEKRNQIITVLSQFRDYYLINNERYKSIAYDKAIKTLKDKITNDNQLSIDNLRRLDNIGKGILEKIISIINKNTCDDIDKIDQKDPRKIFLSISGVGPQCANNLVKSGFKNLEDLYSCGNIEEHLNPQQLIGLKYYNYFNKKIPREEIDKYYNYLNNILYNIDENANLIITGSYRRGLKESNDIDILINSNDKNIFKCFISKLNEMNILIDHIAFGNKKYNGVFKLNKKSPPRRIDILLTNPNEAAFALLHFTGSNEFNKKIRKYCNEKNLSISEHGLKDLKTNQMIDKIFKSEKEIFDYLDLKYLKPEDR